MKKIQCIIVCCGITACLSLTAQERKQLDDVRRQIERLEADLRTKETRERSLLERAEDVDRKTGLQKTLLRHLEEEQKQQEQRIRLTGRSLQETMQGYSRLKGEVSRRIVSMYKQGKVGEWEALLSMRSLNQGMVWLKYQKRIVENDRRNLRLLAEKQRTIEIQNQTLQNELQEKEELIREERQETATLETQKKTQAALLEAMRDDLASLREQIGEKQSVFREIEGRISRIETRRRAAPPTGESSRFPEFKGKLDWPIQGGIVQKYGPQKDPVFNTITTNIGVVIEGKAGEDVQAVSGGKVYWVTWQRGEGNLIILDHNGFYTVYGRLEMVLVSQDEEVERGDVLGQIGDDSSLYGSLLFFSVWNGRDSENPENWLR